MFSETYYLIRTKRDGQYLVARPRVTSAERSEAGFLLLFKEQSDAMIYLNTHAAELAQQFGIESVPGSQLKAMAKRWGFQGFGIVQDPLLPRVEFLVQQDGLLP
jgi:hypothetical protein